jgi:hypothetical protein
MFSQKNSYRSAQRKRQKQGGQQGHEGYTLKMVATPDKIEIHHPTHCSCCHRIFDVSEVSATVSKRQVFDIPAPKIFVTEHQVGSITCCRVRQSGSFPAQVCSPCYQVSNNGLSMVSALCMGHRFMYAYKGCAAQG